MARGVLGQFFQNAGTAISRLEQDGERVFTALALGVPERAVTLRGI